MHTHQILLPFSSSLHRSKMLRNYTWALPSWTLSLPVSLQEITYQGPSFLRLCTKPSLAFPLRSLADQRWLWADQRWLWCQQVMTGSNARKPLSQWDASLNKMPTYAGPAATSAKGLGAGRGVHVHQWCSVLLVCMSHAPNLMVQGV